jgi:hypothetical protein
MEQNFDFPDWGSFLDHAEKAPCTSQTFDRASYTGSKSFTNTDSFAEAVGLARNGWKDGIKKALAVALPIQRKLYSLVETHRIQYDVIGEILDVGRYCSGEPEHWGYWEQHGTRQGKGMQFVHVVMNGTASCGIDANVLMTRGAVVAALCNLLELSGCRAKITFCYKAVRGDHSSTILVTLKDYGDPIDLDQITMALAHPSTFRRLGFAVWETCSETMRDKCGFREHEGYGQQGDLPKEQQGDIYLEKMTYGDERWETPENATAWAHKKLKELGVLPENHQLV